MNTKSFFKNFGRFRRILLELFIVFVGVYGAFYLNSYTQTQREKINRNKVLLALSEEVLQLGKTFQGIAKYQKQYNSVAEQKYNENLPLPELERLRYVAPQYSLEVLENALSFNTFELLDLPLHIKLSRYYSDIQKLIDAEREITELSHNYVFLEIYSNEARREQYWWSILYLKDRETLLQRLSENSKELVAEIDKRINLYENSKE